MTPESLKRRVNSIADMRRRARRRLPRGLFDLADGGAEDELTLRRNEFDFADIAFLPKPLDGPGPRDLSVTLFGHKLSLPVLIGPTALQGLFWPDGERCAARAAAAAGTGICLSHGALCTMEVLAGTGVTPRFMQTFIYRDRGFLDDFIERAEAAGYHGLIITIDNQVSGNRERDIRNGYTIPPQFGPVMVADVMVKPAWLWRLRGGLGDIRFANYIRDGKPVDLGSREMRATALFDPDMSWKDIAAVRARWKGALILKGLQHPDEARAAVDHGVDAVIVSNHGGRQLDGAASTIASLPGVVAAAGGRMPVLIDGGFRRGADVVKALCLGATACLIGRPNLWGLAVGGEAGVARVLDIYRSEIDRVMGLLGAATVADLGPHLLHR